MAAMGLTGADFAGALKSRKKFVEANDEGADAVEGTGAGDAPASAWGGVTSFTDKSPTGCCGLSNQGATCYLNSLLQTLFMLPAFRASVYAWRYDPARDGKEETCIPLQLQRLFARLQCSSRAAVSTKPVHASQNDSAA